MRTASYVLRMTREESATLITSWRAPSEVFNRALLALANQLLSQFFKSLPPEKQEEIRKKYDFWKYQ